MGGFFNIVASATRIPPSTPVEVEGYYSDAFMSAINDSPDTVINLGEVGQTYLLDKPVTITSPNKTLNILGAIKVKDGVSRFLTQDSPIGSNVLYVDNSDGAFQVGQQVCSTDNTQFKHGDQLSRRYSNAFFITAVTDTTITCHAPSIYGLTMAANASVGHYQSPFIVEANNIIFQGGGGEIDGNGPNQSWEIYVGNSLTLPFEDTRFGCNIARGEDSPSISGLEVHNVTLRNAPLHNICLWNVSNWSLTGFNSYNVHDKHILFYNATFGLIDDFVLDGSLYEDGFSVYRFSHDIQLGTGSISNCPRNPLTINNGNYNITSLPGSVITTTGGRVKIEGYYISFETLIVDRNNENSGLTIYAFELLQNGSAVDSNYIKHLVIKNSPITAMRVRDGVTNFIIDEFTLENCTKGMAIWGGDTTINSGRVENISSNGLSITGTAYLKMANVDFINVTGFDPTSTPADATLILENCTGVTNGTY